LERAFGRGEVLGLLDSHQKLEFSSPLPFATGALTEVALPRVDCHGKADSGGELRGNRVPAALEDYALIGDCETSALVGRDGSIDWLCWPTFDSAACFSALLGDKNNGRWIICPSDEVVLTSRHYRRNTLVLETAFETADGSATLIDFMPPRGDASHVVRIVRGDRGRVRFRTQVILRFGFGLDIPWVRRDDKGELIAICGSDMTVMRTPVDLRGKDMTTVADFEVSEGDSVPFVMSYGPSHLALPASIDAMDALSDTEAFWIDWSARSNYRGQSRDLIMRSLITLKALTFAPTGGMVAAPTTSLPEKLGGTRNWDYRFCWLRDATCTLLAFQNSGYTDEALAWHRWLLRSVAGTPASMQIMYGITGVRRLPEWQADWLAGYEGAKPVRIGNAAHEQLQLDVYGELLDSFYQARVAGLNLDDGTWAVECQVLKHLSEIWGKADSGIWERRGPPQHYVSSKVMSWVAFDRGIKSAEKFGLKAPLNEWRTVRNKIHEDVCTNGFDPDLNAFTVSYGTTFLDASILLMPVVGFLPANDPRVIGTLKAVERHLLVDGFVMRHDRRDPHYGSEHSVEGAFLACSLWLADAWLLAGDIDKARRLFDRVVGVANDVGLLAEEYDVGAARQVGNFPQALTHIALINTAQNLAEANRQTVATQRARAG
jgi:GH15 family glucan-1,4-alpha-glucosidase